MPFSADPQSNACYPFHLLRSIITPAYDQYATAISLHIMILVHLLFAGLGVVLLAREYGLSRWAGLAGAMVFIAGPFSLIYCTEFYVYPLVTSWAPWIVWAAQRTLTVQNISGRLYYAAWTALFFGLSTLGAFPQLTLYIGVMLGGFVILHGLLHIEWAGFQHFCRGFFRTAFGSGVFLLMVAVVGALLAAVMLLPAYELGMQSARVASSGVKVGSGGHNTQWLHLLKCLVIFPGVIWSPIGCRAAGIGSLLALVAALGHNRKRDAIVFIGLYLLLTDCTIGPPFPVGSLLHRYDFLNITVSPWRAGILSGLGLAMATAFGVDAAGRAATAWSKSAFRTIWLLNTGLLMLYLLMQWLEGKPLFHPWIWVWVFPLGTLAAMCLFSWIRLPRLGVAVIACLVIGEILAWGMEFTPRYVASRIGGGSTARFQTITEMTRENKRTAVGAPNWQMWTLDMTMNGYNPLYVGETRRLLCKPGNERAYKGHLKQDEVLVENHYGNLFLKRTFWLARQWATGSLPGKNQVFPAATTVFLPDTAPGTPLPVPEIPHKEVPSTAVSDKTERVELGEGKALLSKIKKVGQEVSLPLPPFQQNNRHSVLYVGYTATNLVDLRPVCTDERRVTYKLKRSRAATTKKEQFLEIPLPDCGTNTITLKWPAITDSRLHLTKVYVLKDSLDENEHISIVERKANSVEILITDLPGPRLLTCIDSYYQGWHAWVDDQEVPILKANEAFKAVVVPEGTHTVIFKFQPWTVYLGLAISFSTALFLLLVISLLGLYRSYKRRKASREEHHIGHSVDDPASGQADLPLYESSQPIVIADFSPQEPALKPAPSDVPE